MGRDEDTLDVQETGYVGGGSDRPVEDTQVHAASTSEGPELRMAAPVHRRHAEPHEAVPNVRASVRSAEEVERDRLPERKPVPTGLIAASFALATLMFGGLALGAVVLVVFLLWPSAAPEQPSEVGGVPIRHHLGDP